MKKKVLLSSIATIALCLCLIAGSTFALFTSKSEVNIAVTSGNVDVVATVENFKYYSVKADPNGTIIDENGGKYVYDDRTDEGTFANGGTAVQSGSMITLEKITPGDMISFGIEATNKSDVAIQCRYIIQCVSGEELMEGLVVYINDDAFPVLKSYTSAWTALAVGESITDSGNIEIAVELPVTAGNEYENKEVAINVLVEAVQGNADIGANNGPVIEFLANSNATAVSDAASLQAALDNAVAGENTIVVTGDIVGDVTATQKADVKTTIEGNGYTFAGALTVDGKSARYATAGLTIKNFNFEADSLTADAYINLGNGNSGTRYTNNVTVQNCTFSYSGAEDKVAVKSYTGGDKNLTLDGLTVNAGMHSMLQVTNVEEGLKITDCKVNAKNGINLNNTPALEMSGCEFDTVGYCVRFGVNGSTNNGTFTIANSTFISANDDGDAVIILRGTMTGATLTLTNTTLTGTPDITGSANIVNN